MLFDSTSDLLRILVVAPLAYLWLVALLRLSGKRTLAQLNAFDFIVTVALGSTVASVILTSSVSWSEGALALGLLVAFQLVVAWVSVRVGWVRRSVTSTPSVLLLDGTVDHVALRRERISESSLRQAVRSSGSGGLERVAAVVLEPDGTLSVIPAGDLGSGSAMPEA